MNIMGEKNRRIKIHSEAKPYLQSKEEFSTSVFPFWLPMDKSQMQNTGVGRKKNSETIFSSSIRGLNLYVIPARERKDPWLTLRKVMVA